MLRQGVRRARNTIFVDCLIRRGVGVPLLVRARCGEVQPRSASWLPRSVLILGILVVEIIALGRMPSDPESEVALMRWSDQLLTPNELREGRIKALSELALEGDRPAPDRT